MVILVEKQRPFRVINPPDAIIWNGVRPVDHGNAVRLEKRDHAADTELLAAVIYQLPEKQ